MRYTLIFVFGFALFLAGCKREVPNQEPNLSMGITYSLPGNQLIVGSIKSPDGGYLLYGYNDKLSGSQDGFLMKLDQDQQLVWQKTIGGTRIDEFRSACYDKDGNILATGMSISYDKDNRRGDFPTMFTVYLTGTGDIIWEKYFSAPSTARNNSTVANKVLYLPNGNFALVGSSINFTSKLPNGSVANNLSRAFILYINTIGDTLGSSSYDVLTDINDSGDYYQESYGINAAITEEGNILLLVIKEKYKGNIFNPSSIFSVESQFLGGLTFIKIDPNKPSGYNAFIWRKTIPQLNIYRTGEPDTYFFPMSFSKTYSAKPSYCLVYPSEGNFAPNFAIISEEAELLSKPVASTPLLSSLTAIQSQGGISWIASGVTISKVTENGVIAWTQSLGNLVAFSAIFPQPNESLLLFCHILNNKSETDITCVKLDANGKFLK